MSKSKKIISISLGLVLMAVFTLGTIAYFRRTVNGNIMGLTGDLVLIVNEANSKINESFTITLNENSAPIIPGDKDKFNLNIDSTGSSDDVIITVSISRTNLPNNLKFYIDERYTREFDSNTLLIRKSEDMTTTVPVYWYWDGGIDNQNDILYIDTLIEAQVNVTAMIANTTNLFDNLVSDAKLDTDVDFSQGASDTNGQGLMMLSSTQNEQYPIVYYRGDVVNNNVIFADLCWLIVRTTETGGIKLIYNGEVNLDGSCNNYSGVGNYNVAAEEIGAYIANLYYNNEQFSPVYGGYMYNDDNKYYTYTDIITDGVLDSVGFLTHLSDDTIDSITGRHLQNKYDSNAKKIIENWYEETILKSNYKNLLEDTVWCNDRSIISTTFTPENYVVNNSMFIYGAATRLMEYAMVPSLTFSPSLTCNRDMDKFTVESSNGNGDLTYPIGMLTADEVVLAGNTFFDRTMNYLSTDTFSNFTMSPMLFDSGSGVQMMTITDYSLQPSGVKAANNYVRPSISLQNKIEILDGNGSFKQPYLVG